MQIQIVTINTWKCDGDYYQRRQVLANQLKTLTPHIIACQECFLSEDEKIDTLRFLAEELDMYYHFTPARFKNRLLGNDEVSSHSGLGVLSAFPIKVFAEFDLPISDADGERKVQQILIEITEQKRLLLTNVHLTHLQNAVELRKNQLTLIAQKTVDKNVEYNIICGDFNTTPDSEEIAQFKNQTKAIDCYETGDGKAPRISLIENNTERNVDYIFALPAGRLREYPTVTKSAIVLNTADESGVYPSDHFGISTTLITA
ncbi:endonuclease/exonuclease/phosphatase family protein [Mucilaginibacter jinjuensis]|uniref:Endonuclease/exonuclease/phosphatase family protein n=1 Tax=Mucilaginibacter jinjuensis TaxID=1176721 RepID=A0ABY7TF18_9SPHI|nr:endonuclease/exonuclease/phosphatase family protein [Mucilaginibacter jinjuensis]WCT14605.1 endonuclease/exonuclease/phosphatase family protein [Mucilaginibacter jinjuensis]